MDEHSLQSPFLFKIYQKALNSATRKTVKYPQVEALRNKLTDDKREIKINHFGSGSSMSMTQSKLIKSIARSGISEREQSEILVNLLEIYDCKNILELGTSLGLNTISLSLAKGIDQVITIEGNAELMMIAQSHFDLLNCKNIEPIVADIDQYLDETCQTFDLIYIDANHTYEATLRYFEKSLNRLSEKGIIVIDDINWSPGMSSAWAGIVSTFQNNIYLENNKLGIVFANVHLDKSHYILRF